MGRFQIAFSFWSWLHPAGQSAVSNTALMGKFCTFLFLPFAGQLPDFLRENRNSQALFRGFREILLFEGPKRVRLSADFRHGKGVLMKYWKSRPQVNSVHKEASVASRTERGHLARSARSVSLWAAVGPVGGSLLDRLGSWVPRLERLPFGFEILAGGYALQVRCFSHRQRLARVVDHVLDCWAAGVKS